MAALQTAALLLLLLAAASDAGEPPQQERTALQTFLAGTSHERALGWNSPSAPSACLWFGVTCDTDNATVVAVRLPGVGLVGGLPAGTLGTLPSLRTLSLRSNRLSGAVPGDIFSLPNLRSLYLQNNRLSGAVPPELAGLTALRHLALYDNELSGEIPVALDDLAELRSIRLDRNRLSGGIPSLSGLRRLEVFNVSDNQLDGAIPASLARFPPDSFSGNLGLCGEPLDLPCGAPPASSEKKTKRISGAAIAAIAVGAGAGALLALILLVLCCLACRRRDPAASGDNGNKATSTPTQATGFTPSPVSGEMSDLADMTSSKDLVPAAAGEATTRRLVFVGGGAPAGGYSFDLEDLLRASAEVLGKGGAGTTYKAVLEDGATVVVKRLKDVSAARREFASALEALGRVEHPNLLPVHAYYFSNEEKLLVADYLPAGSLAAALHGSRGSGRTPMDWDARVRAALCAARGMAHLHGAHGLVHGNVKSSNLLLRQGDPGDAAALSDYSIQHLFAPPPAPSTRAGGYRAPELVDPRRPTFSSDVYSLGVLFLEILTGKCPASGTTGGVDVGGGSALDLPRWVQSVVREEWTAEVFDAELVGMGGGAEEEMVALLQVAMACAATAPDARPDAQEVVKTVEEIGGGRHRRATTEDSWGTPTGASP